MKWISWLAVIGGCVVVAGALGLFKQQQIQAAVERGQSFPERQFAVEKYTVGAIERQPSLAVTGEVVAQRSAILQNELQGRIVEVGFAAGEQVTKGQVLLRLDVAEEQAQLREALANQEIARLALERASRLLSRAAGSVEARDQARAQHEAAQARVAALQATIDKKTLRAPFDAVTGLHRLEAGQFLDSGTEITELIGVSEQAWIDFSVPQEHANLATGQPVFVVAGNMRVAAQVIALDAAVSVRSRNRRMRASVQSEEPMAGQALLPGMLVQVSIPLGTSQQLTVVPATAVRRDAFGASVYVLERTRELEKEVVRARKQSVELAVVQDADQSDDMVVVREGLRPGDQIASVGAFKLFDGALVVPAEPNAAAQNRAVGL